MKSKLIILPYLIAALFVFFAACSSDGCLENHSAIPLAACYSSQTGEAATVRGIAIHGVGAPGDSILIDSTASFSQIYLPMRSTAGSTSWCLAYAIEGLKSPEWNDTITFVYDSEPYFASEECGAMFNYRIREVYVTTHLLDSVVVLDSLINNLDIVRIRLYFPTES